MRGARGTLSPWTPCQEGQSALLDLPFWGVGAARGGRAA